MDSSLNHSAMNPEIRRQADAIRQRADRRADRLGDRRKGDRRVGVNGRRTVDADDTAPRNVMEVLIEGEIDLQLRQLSEKQRSSVKRAQVMAHALNRLPSLYVTSAKGWRQQWVRGKGDLNRDVEMAVRRAMIAVQQDPLRAMSPVNDCMPDVAESPMAQLRMLLQDKELSWETLVPTIQRLLVEGKMNFPDEMPKSGRSKARRSPQDSRAAGSSAQATDTASGEPTPSAPLTFIDDESFDWDNHPLHQRGY